MEIPFLTSIVIGICLEGFFLGLYSGIFAMYLQYQSEKGTNNAKNVVFYALCILYVFSFAGVVLEVTRFIYLAPIGLQLRLVLLETTLNGFCDFISQAILIYRCWIVWGSNIRVVVLPSILAFTFLATWLASGYESDLSSKLVSQRVWPDWMNVGSIAISMTVNALVTGLIAFRIFKVYREVKLISAYQILGDNGGNKIRTLIFIIIESGMVLMSLQVARLVAVTVQTATLTEGAVTSALNIIVCTHNLLNGITPTIILVRVSMGLSFHDKRSTTTAIESLCFAINNSNSIPETGDNDIVPKEDGEDGIGVRRSDDIQMISR